MKYVFSCLSTLFCISAGACLLPNVMADAVTLANGTTHFTQPPRLISATTPYTNKSTWGTTYYFTLQLPVNAGEPLQQVTFAQTEGFEDIRFNLEDTSAFEGTRKRQGSKLAIKSATSTEQKQNITVTFDSPVAPGKTVTIALKPVHNPNADGNYLFKVMAYPAGQQTAGQFIGTGRLQFYTNGQ